MKRKQRTKTTKYGLMKLGTWISMLSRLVLDLTTLAGCMPLCDGFMHREMAPWILRLAPFHFPGPSSRYWLGRHGPK